MWATLFCTRKSEDLVDTVVNDFLGVDRGTSRDQTDQGSVVGKVERSRITNWI